MANDRVQCQLEHLKAIRQAGLSEETVKDLKKALSDRVNAVVAKAAIIAGEWDAKSLLRELLAAFSRLLTAPETDPQCLGKNALAKSLKDLGCFESAVFLNGLKHFQFENTWGGKVEVAGVLRGTCALALVQCTDLPRHETLVHLVDAITDPDAGVRADAARALEQMGGRDTVLLLRLKARAGDAEVRVTGQVLESILQMEGASAVPFVAGFLRNGSEEVGEEAALALGASRLQEAIQALVYQWQLTHGRRGGEVLLRALSASRQDQALDFLITQISKARLHVAEEAVRALALHRDSEEIVKRVEEAVSGREELNTLFVKLFGTR